MYTPSQFRVTDRAILHAVMDRFSFATLVTAHDGHPMATHLPFLVDPYDGEHGRLVAHMARANDQWRDFERGNEALVIFQGQHAYVSPSWYRANPSVPTWNYVAVHAYGVPQVIDDEARVREVLRMLVDKHEAGFEEPWSMDLPEPYLTNMMRGIVAFEMRITRIDGKFKLSQNRSGEDREQVVAALAGSGDPMERELAALMREST